MANSYAQKQGTGTPNVGRGHGQGSECDCDGEQGLVAAGNKYGDAEVAKIGPFLLFCCYCYYTHSYQPGGWHKLSA